MAKKKKKGVRRGWGNNFPPRKNRRFWGRWHRSVVIRHVDGDTFHIRKKDLLGYPISIRVASWQAPEKGTIGGCTAEALLKLILPVRKQVWIKPAIPSYHRLVARVRKGSIDVSRILARVRITAKRNDRHLCPVKPPAKATWPKKASKK